MKSIIQYYNSVGRIGIIILVYYIVGICVFIFSNISLSTNGKSILPDQISFVPDYIMRVSMENMFFLVNITLIHDTSF